MKAFLFLLMTTLLTSCSEDRPPAPSAEESDQLNEAEDLLNDMASEEADR